MWIFNKQFLMQSGSNKPKVRVTLVVGMLAIHKQPL